MKIYDTKGVLVSEIAFSIDYDNICITDNTVVIYNDMEMGIYSYSGKECFVQTFETPLIEIFPTASRSKYLLIYTNETQLIKLQ